MWCLFQLTIAHKCTPLSLHLATLFPLKHKREVVIVIIGWQGPQYIGLIALSFTLGGLEPYTVRTCAWRGGGDRSVAIIICSYASTHKYAHKCKFVTKDIATLSYTIIIMCEFSHSPDPYVECACMYACIWYISGQKWYCSTSQRKPGRCTYTLIQTH